MASVASSTPDQRQHQLLAASAQANEAQVRKILAEDPPWASQIDRDALRLSLQKACVRGKLGVVKLLLDHGADVEPRRDTEVAALYKAAEAGHLVVVAELLARGANPNMRVRARAGQTALFPACFRGHIKVAELLLDHGASAHMRDREGRTPLLFWAAEKKPPKPKQTQPQSQSQSQSQTQADAWTRDMLHLLLSRGGASLEVYDAIGRTPLLWTAANGNVQLADALLGDARGTDLGKADGPPRVTAIVSAKNSRGRTALHLAAEANEEGVVQLLLQHKADHSIRSDGGWTALHNAAQSGHHGITARLLDAGADVNATLSNGMTPLHWAAFSGHESIVRLLLSRPETRLDIKDGFGRTPMLCAAERYHGTIVQLLSPVHAANRLSPAALAACQKFNATIVDFGNFHYRKQDLPFREENKASKRRDLTYMHRVSKKSVYDVLYGWDAENNRPTVETQRTNISYEPEFRWIHLPANNISWVEALLSKWFIEGGHRDIEPFKAMQNCFDQEHRGPHAHSHFMRTFCKPILPVRKSSQHSTTDQNTGQPPVSDDPNLASQASHADMKLHAGGSGGEKLSRSATHDQQSSGSEAAKKKGKGEQIAERHGKRQKRTNGHPGNPPGTKALRARAAAHADLDSSQIVSSNGIVVMFMPFLHFETHERRQRMSDTIQLIKKDGWNPPEDCPPDVNLVKGYLNSAKPLHPRRTLDQFFYHGIDTSIRDVDQVVYRYCEHYGLKEKKVFMVDQLWLWVLSKDLIITCFPQRWEQPSQDPLNVIDGIIEDTNAKTRPPVRSVFDLAMLITNRCSGIFGRYRPADQEYQFLDMFENSIGRVTNTESQLFMRFNEASAKSAKWLEQSRRSHGMSAPSSSSSSSSLPSLSHSNSQGGSTQEEDSTRVFPDALLDIGTETSLLAEIKDIRDELNILLVVLVSQIETLQELESSLTEVLLPGGMLPRRLGGRGQVSVVNQNSSHMNSSGNKSNGDSAVNVDLVSEIRRRSYDQKRLLEVNRKDIERMDRQAEGIYVNLTHLLDLKQKHSNALEARFARDHAMIAARQGQTIMAFTIVTILFLPMSFIAAFFSIQIKSWQDTLTVSYVSKYMFGIGLGISIPLIILAFKVEDVYASLRFVYLTMQRQKSGRPWGRYVSRQTNDKHSILETERLNTGGNAGSDGAHLSASEKKKMEILSGVYSGHPGGVHKADAAGLPRASWNLSSRGGMSKPSSTLSHENKAWPMISKWGPARSEDSRAIATIASRSGPWPSLDKTRLHVDEDIEMGPPPSR